MAKTKKHTSLYEYLDQSGLLESNDDELIQRARAAYWKNYHKLYKRAKRGAEKEYSIRLSKQEEKLLLKEAIRHDASMSQFVKQSALAYIRQAFILPEKESLTRFEQILSKCYDSLVQLMEKKTAHEKEAQLAIGAVMLLEDKIRMIFLQPVQLEYELQKALGLNPLYAETIKKILDEYDYKIKGKEVNDRH